MIRIRDHLSFDKLDKSIDSLSLSKITKKYRLNNKKYNILILVDENSTIESFSKLLEKRGHRVTIVNEGLSCMRKCQNHWYDIIFMDFHLSNLDCSIKANINIIELLKDCSSKKSIIFAFTSNNDTNIIDKIRCAGSDGAIIKPIESDLMTKLMTSLEIYQTVDKRCVKVIRESGNKLSNPRLFIF